MPKFRWSEWLGKVSGSPADVTVAVREIVVMAAKDKVAKVACLIPAALLTLSWKSFSSCGYAIRTNSFIRGERTGP